MDTYEYMQRNGKSMFVTRDLWNEHLPIGDMAPKYYMKRTVPSREEVRRYYEIATQSLSITFLRK